jgi:hypothetical protein
MNVEDHKRLFQLFGGLAEGTLTESEHRELQERLRSDPAARRLWYLHNDLDQGLHLMANAHDAGAMAEAAHPVVPMRTVGARWLQWRSLTAAAAGLAFGLFGASMVWAYALPRLPALPPRVIPLLEDGFETASQPEVKGVPNQLGAWGGDHARIVTGEQGIAPRSGTKMLRFLRSDFEGEKSALSYSCDQLRVIDLHRYEALIDTGNATLNAAAWFRLMAPQSGEAFTVGISISAFDADPTRLHGLDWLTWEDTERLGFNKTQRPWLVGDRSSWREATGELRLPRGTRFVNVHVRVSRKEPAPTATPVTFAGAYADDVSVRLLVADASAPVLAKNVAP